MRSLEGPQLHDGITGQALRLDLQGNRSALPEKTVVKNDVDARLAAEGNQGVCGFAFRTGKRNRLGQRLLAKGRNTVRADAQNNKQQPA